MRHKIQNRISKDFLKFADVKDPDYYVKFQLAQKLIEDLSKEELEKLFKFEVLDYRTFDFRNCKSDALLEKVLNLQRMLEVEYYAEIDIEPEITFEQCLREEFLINTQNYPKEYHDLFFKKFERAEQRFRKLSSKN